MRVSDDHWLNRTRRVQSPNCNSRPDDADISLLVIHGISLPAGCFGTQLIEALFSNTLDTSAEPSLADLAGLRVSSHLLIDRRGRATQFVPFDRRAWHAGESSWCGRSGCNDFSIGIELEGCDEIPYTKAQYRRLLLVAQALLNRYPRLSLNAIVGHLEIAPGRKTDPGPAFDWPRFLLEIATGARGR